MPTGRIRRYWTHGEGAAKIDWGVPGDFDRCRGFMGKYVEPQYLAGTCANMHKEAIGVWPGQEGGGKASILERAGQTAVAFNLVASAAVADLPPAEWFQDPQLQGPTPITIEGERIFGHIATWGTCHIGMAGVCTEAPRSATDYAWFRLGAVETQDGLVPVGQITMGSGHADLRKNAAAAAAHYDNTATAVADVASGEDEHGIWFAGRLRPSVSADQRASLLAAKLSGDWRSIQGNLELVAALAVNIPGFGIPRLSLAASALGGQTALVAAGIVPTPTEQEQDEQDLPTLVAAAVSRELARRDRLEGIRLNPILDAMRVQQRAARAARALAVLGKF